MTHKPDFLTHDPELTAYVVALREALTHLVDGMRRRAKMPAPLREHPLFSLEVMIQEGETVLAMETGRHAQREFEVMQCMVEAGYTLADWCHQELYGTPRSPSGLVPTRGEVADALEAIQRLTRESWRLNAMLREEAS